MLVESSGVHTYNDLCDTKFRIFALDRPLGLNATQRAEIVLNDARFTELDVNLLYFRQVYQGILEQREQERGLGRGGQEKQEARCRYSAHVEEQLAEVERMLAVVAQIERERYEAERSEGVAEPSGGPGHS